MGDIRITPRTRGKVAQTDYDFWLTQSEDRCLYCLSKRQIAIILASLPMSEWRTRWFSEIGTEPDMDLIQATIAELETELMTDHCDLDAAITDIQNNITTINNNVLTINTNITTINENVTNIDASLTVIDNSITNINTEIKIIQDNQYITNIYNNITNINIALNYSSYTVNSLDTTNEEAIARFNAFCYAMVDWVCCACARYGEIFDYSVEDYLHVLALVETAITTFEPFVAIAGMPKNADLIDIIGETRAEAALTEAAVNEIACAMATYLQYKEPTQATFILALDDWVAANPTPIPPPPAPDGWTDAQVIGAMCHAALVINGAFEAWASIADYWFQKILATHPTEYICLPCAVPLSFCSIPQTWDFTALNLPPWTINRGVLTEGEGVVGTTIPGDTNASVEVNIYFPTPCTALAGHHIEITHAHLSNVGNSFVIQYWYLLAGVPTLYNSSSRAQVLAWPQDDVDSLIIPNPPGSVGIYRIRFACLTTYAPVTGLSTSVSSASAIRKIRFLT
jgi:hypothetical protein